MTVRTASAVCALAALALPALAGGPATIRAAERSIGIAGQVFELGDGAFELTDEFFATDSSTALSGPFANAFSDTNQYGRAEGSIDSDLFTTANGFVLQSFVTGEASAGGTPQFAMANTSTTTTASVEFELSSPASYAIDGLATAFSFIGGFSTAAQASLSIELTGPSGTVLSESYSIFDFPFDDPEFPAFIDGALLISEGGDLDPGSYALTISSSIVAGAGNSQLGQTNAEFGHGIAFSVVPAPSALALLTIAPIAIRRRR